MPLRGIKMPFSDLMIEIEEESSGVYVLWNEKEIVYIGKAEALGGIRKALSSHLRGDLFPTGQEVWS